MLELPETQTLAAQATDCLQGKVVRSVTVGHSPHKFAWFTDTPEEYGPLLEGEALGSATASGMFVAISTQSGKAQITCGDGVRMRWYAPGEALPDKHQLLIEFEDDSSLVYSVQMYGGMWVTPGGFDNTYYQTALEKPSPLTNAFDKHYFETIVSAAKPSLSAKGLLATEQRIPGLGNGVLQDILFGARVNPKTPVGKLGSGQLEDVFASLKSTLAEMAAKGGRDTEKDLYGCNGGYKTILSAKTAGKPCPVCGATIEKLAYMGGSVYFCPACQPLPQKGARA